MRSIRILLAIFLIGPLPAFSDEPCDMPPLPLQERLDNRNFPSLFTPWGLVPTNQPQLSDTERMSQHDLYFGGMGLFAHGLHHFETQDGWQVRGDIDVAVRRRNEYVSHNPNMVFLAAMPAVFEEFGTFPDDSPYWLRDDDGSILTGYGFGWVNLSHPEVQERIIQKAVAVSKCGLYDGILFDFWNELHGRQPTDYPGMIAILKGIRERVRPEFLIMGNTNRGIAPTFASYMNGSFLESSLPFADSTSGADGISRGFSHMEETLLWSEQNYRSPQINSFLGFGSGAEPMGSPTNRRYMRAITTLNLTFSDGYFMYYLHTDGAVDTNLFAGFYWYDFWDTDLGRPIGAKSQLYNNLPGLYIREFTKGWAVYNHSGAAQVVTLPQEVQSAASGLSNTEQAVLNLDGDIFLKLPPALPGDINGDGMVNILDLTIVARAMGMDDALADVNRDGVVNVFDLVFVANQF